jgi:hypothetical protein
MVQMLAVATMLGACGRNEQLVGRSCDAAVQQGYRGVGMLGKAIDAHELI